MYHIQVDPYKPGGLSLFNFGDNYPRVATVADMIGPMAYLASSVEFNELANQTNKKLAVDNFWLESAGNVQTARELIRVYYNRVFFANYFFTSYKEGWKTDRGMMFIVYGPPNILTKKGDTEIWVYYRKKSREPLQFTFTRHTSPYTQNDFLLERNFVTSMWVQAVRDWRSGKIFYTESI
jgi:GWxTD domain-containing protein